MAKKHTDVDPKAVHKEDEKQKDRPIREGQQDNSVMGDEQPPEENGYPRKQRATRQYDHEPEFRKRDAEDNSDR